VGDRQRARRSHGLEPQLGTWEDWDQLRRHLPQLGIEIALDYVMNCSPDHPYVAAHPDWFFHRPDGSIKYAENPPKKYQDVYPLNFGTSDRAGLWQEMLKIFLFWVDKGVTTFRVDNPHTKPVPFWEWVIGEVHRQHPGSHLPRRSLHQAENDAPAGQGRITPSPTPTSPGATTSMT
jgi:starch synthase (maltosyl-transferring)